MAGRTDLKIPYGVANFKRIRTEGYYYVDKTEYLAKMEERDSFVFFVRPRRFGKSLFLDMLRLYYDRNELKHSAADASEAELRAKADEGIAKLRQYASDPSVPDLAKDTTLHLILFQFKGFDLHRLEEIPQSPQQRHAMSVL